jgi:predicted  nucleic acid-binding Zn-ribbon protein
MQRDVDILNHVVGMLYASYDDAQRSAFLSRLSKRTIIAFLGFSGELLENVPCSIKDDKDVVMAAVKQRGCAIKYASEKFKADKEVVMAAVKCEGDALQYISESLKADKEVVLAAVKQNAFAILNASEIFKTDKEMILAVVKCNGSALQCISESLKADKEVVMAAVKQTGRAISDVPTNFKADKEVVMAAVKQYGTAIVYASESLKTDIEVVMAAVKCEGDALHYVPTNFKADKEVVMAAVKQDGCAIRFASESLRADKEVVMIAVKQNGDAIEYISESLKTDKEVVLAAKAQRELKLANCKPPTSSSSSPLAAAAAADNKSRNHLKPPAFDETVLTLKASTTQLISVVILGFLLVPFYDSGLSWWGNGAKQFVFTGFDFPQFHLQFSVSFSWPKFSQPRLGVQLATGVFLLIVQYLIKIGKWLLINFSSHIVMPNTTPDYWEYLMLQFFAGATWHFFRAPMEIAECALGQYHVNMQRAKKSGDQMEVLKAVLFFVPLLAYYAINRPRVKTMPHQSGDNEVLDFCHSEDSMAVRSIELLGENTTTFSVQVVSKCCPWMKITKLNLSSAAEEGEKVGVCGVINNLKECIHSIIMCLRARPVSLFRLLS